MTKEKIDNSKLLADSGLRVVHVRPYFDNNRAMTVAFRMPRDVGHNIEIATAITNPSDTFTKKIGTKLAIENFLAGHTVLVPDDNRRGAVNAIKQLFRGY